MDMITACAVILANWNMFASIPPLFDCFMHMPRMQAPQTMVLAMLATRHVRANLC